MSIYERITLSKGPPLEETTKSEAQTLKERFEKQIDCTGEAIVFGVMRGKLSEGLNYKDRYARATIILVVF